MFFKFVFILDIFYIKTLYNFPLKISNIVGHTFSETKEEDEVVAAQHPSKPAGGQPSVLRASLNCTVSPIFCILKIFKPMGKWKKQQNEHLFPLCLESQILNVSPQVPWSSF